jgi:hypothetical protein
LTHQLGAICQADTSKDGRIDFEEFQTIMQNKASGAETFTWNVRKKTGKKRGIRAYITNKSWD